MRTYYWNLTFHFYSLKNWQIGDKIKNIICKVVVIGTYMAKTGGLQKDNGANF
jgi:hypothetical protein